jgi:DNA-binding transcriptional MerR regulator
MQHGNRLYAENVELIPDEEKPSPSQLTLRGGLLLLLLGGFVFTAPALVLASYLQLLRSFERQDLIAEFEKYQRVVALSVLPGDEAAGIYQLFRQTGKHLRWERVPGTATFRMTTSLPAFVGLHAAALGTSRSNAARFAAGVLQRPLFVHGLAVAAAVLQQRGAAAGAGAEQLARLRPFLDVQTQRCDLFVLNLFVRCTGGALAATVLGTDAVCETLVDLGDMAPALEKLRRAMAALGDVDAQRQLMELGFTIQEQQALLDETRADVAEASAALTARVEATAAEVQELRERWLPPSDQLVVTRYMIEHRLMPTPFDDADGALASEEQRRMLFGRLVCAELSRRGLEDTVSHEPFGRGRRAVYSRERHLVIFDYVRCRHWPAALRELEGELREQEAERRAIASQVHCGAEGLRMYRAARAAGLLALAASAEDEEARYERLLWQFQRRLPHVVDHLQLPEGVPDGSGATRWTRIHLPAFEQAFAEVLAKYLAEQRPPRRAGRSRSRSG